MDDGSTDNTLEVVSSFHDTRVRYFKKENEERAIARNYGIEQAHGDYVTFLDSDDILYTHFLAEAQIVIETYSNPEWLHLAYEIKDEYGKVLRKENKRKGNINDTFITGNHLSCIGVFVRKDIIQKHKFNEDPDIIGSEDYLLWLELASLYTLRYSNIISASMLHHVDRSVINFKKQHLIVRIEKSIHYGLKNPDINNFLKGRISIFIAHRYLYLANHLSRASYKFPAILYYFRSLGHFPPVFFYRNSLSFLKSLFL